jgi:hypothetical protein
MSEEAILFPLMAKAMIRHDLARQVDDRVCWLREQAEKYGKSEWLYHELNSTADLIEDLWRYVNVCDTK